MNIDNMAEKYVSVSPYHYAGNNPVFNLDVDGNEFTESAWQWVNRLITYVIDIGAEKSIYNEISKAKDRNVIFYIEHLSDSTLKFHLINSNGNDFLRTDRKLFVNDNFYPIIFDTDYLFYSEMKNGRPILSLKVKKNSYVEIPIPSIEEREKNPELYGFKKKSIMIDNSVYWILDKKGKLLKTNTDK